MSTLRVTGADYLELDVVLESAFGTDRQDEVGVGIRRLERLQIREISLIDVEKRIAIRTRDTFGLVGCDTRGGHRSSDIPCGGRYASACRSGRTRIRETNISKGDLLADKDPGRVHAVVDRSEGFVDAGKVRVLALLIRCELIRDLTVRGDRCRDTFLEHRERRRLRSRSPSARLGARRTTEAWFPAGRVDKR